MGRPTVWVVMRCARCKREFKTKPCLMHKGRRFCSAVCRSAALPPPKQIGNLNAFRGDGVCRSALHYRARKVTKNITDCNRCGRKAEITHHADENPSNNVHSNLERLCRRCHINHHRHQLEAGKRPQIAGAAI